MLATILSREKFIFLVSLLVRIGNSNREVPEAWKLTRGLETNLKEESSRELSRDIATTGRHLYARVYEE